MRISRVYGRRNSSVSEVHALLLLVEVPAYRCCTSTYTYIHLLTAMLYVCVCSAGCKIAGCGNNVGSSRRAQLNIWAKPKTGHSTLLSACGTHTENSKLNFQTAREFGRKKNSSCCCTPPPPECQPGLGDRRKPTAEAPQHNRPPSPRGDEGSTP